MRSDLQRFKSVRERDIDYLLLEELTTSESFRRWLLQELGYQPATVTGFIDAWHSVTDSDLGESDIEFGVTAGDGSDLLVLIENKIDATFQDDQLDRYRKRGENATDEDWNEFCTCLIAPESYLEGTDETGPVDETVSYEAIRERFRGRESERSTFKVEMLTEAIEQNRRGYDREPDDDVTELHRFYWTVARDDHPELGMEKPEGVPSGNLWVRFKPQSLHTEVQLIHKMGRGDVDLQLPVSNEQRETFVERHRALLEDDMEVVETGTSLSVRINTQRITADEDPRLQRSRIEAGVEAASRLLDWYTNDYQSNRSDQSGTLN